MKNLEAESEVDELRSSYSRNDFSKFVRGAVTQVEFAERVALVLSCIGEDEQVRFAHHSTGNHLANHQAGDWTYEIDNANQVTLHYWLDSVSTIEVSNPNPPNILTAEDNNHLIDSLSQSVRSLKAKVTVRK
jgi:hypothetical protein